MLFHPICSARVCWVSCENEHALLHDVFEPQREQVNLLVRFMRSLQGGLVAFVVQEPKMAQLCYRRIAPLDSID